MKITWYYLQVNPPKPPNWKIEEKPPPQLKNLKKLVYQPHQEEGGNYFLTLNYKHLLWSVFYSIKTKSQDKKSEETSTYSSLKIVTPAYTTPEPPATPDMGGGNPILGHFMPKS